MTTPGLYRHFKGQLYRVLGTATNATNGTSGERIVIYISLTSGEIYTREEEEFNQAIDESHGLVRRRFNPVHE